jgi:hypothetical protein
VSVLDASGLLATWERGRAQPPLHRALTLFAAGSGRWDADAATVDVGSRDVVLAALLADGFGGPIWTVADCGGCGEQLDVPVDVAAVARLPAHEPGDLFEAQVGDSTISFRLPTTRDLTALPVGDPIGARRWLLARCVPWGDGELPDEVGDAVEAAMEAVSPGGVVEVAVRCAGCGDVTAAVLDVAALLWVEVEAAAVALVHDVHALAAAYGWSEAEVLGLGSARRRAYLELVRG